MLGNQKVIRARCSRVKIVTREHETSCINHLRLAFTPYIRALEAAGRRSVNLQCIQMRNYHFFLPLARKGS